MIRALVEQMERVSRSAWRRITLIYWLALTAGTHWPKLRIGAPGPIPVDKILHALAFAGLAGLLMLTRLLDRQTPRAFAARNINRAAAAALALAAIDELTQYWPALDRFARFDDFVADVIGIAAAWCVAMLVFRRAGGDHDPAGSRTHG